MDLPSTTVDDILSAADANENGFEVASTAVTSGNIATNVDVGSIRLEDILNEQSDDDDDGNVSGASQRRGSKTDMTIVMSSLHTTCKSLIA